MHAAASELQDQRAHNRSITQAYITALLMRTAYHAPKKFPKLKSLLIADKGARAQSPEERWRMLSAEARSPHGR